MRAADCHRSSRYLLIDNICLLDLKLVLPCADAEIMVEAAKVLGKIVRTGCHVLPDRFWPYEVDNAVSLVVGAFIPTPIAHRALRTDEMILPRPST